MVESLVGNGKLKHPAAVEEKHHLYQEFREVTFTGG